MKKLVIIVSIMVMAAGGNLNGQNMQFMEMANAAIEQFRPGVTEQNYKFYGLSKVDALNNVKPGEAIVHYAVGLDKLQRYTPEQDPKELIMEMGFVTIPLLDIESNMPETFVLLNMRDGKYDLTGLGQEPYSKRFMEMQKKMDMGREVDLVRIPALNAAYAAMMVNDTLNLLPLTQERQEMEAMPASEVFSKLAGQASRWKEDVPR